MLSWERIVEIAKEPERAGDKDYRAPETSAAYARSGCTLDLDFVAEWTLVRNAYPYQTELGVTHYVLFRRRDLPMVSPIEFLRGALRAQRDFDSTVAWFENPPERRSIASVRHYHVFVRGAV